MAYDLLIKNGRVVDGSGEPSFHGDVAVKNGKIVGVGKFNGSATRTINADGRVVAPGFIDHLPHRTWHSRVRAPTVCRPDDRMRPPAR